MTTVFRILVPESGEWLTYSPVGVRTTADPAKAKHFGHPQAAQSYWTAIGGTTLITVEEVALTKREERERKQLIATNAAFEKMKPRYGYRMEITGFMRRVRIR